MLKVNFHKRYKERLISFLLVWMGCLILMITPEAVNASGVSAEKALILYETYGGSNHELNPDVITAEDGMIPLHSPHKFGYSFDGWYLEASYQHKVDRIAYFYPGVTVLYARWVPRINSDWNIRSYQYHYEKDAGKNDSIFLLRDCDYSILEQLEIPGMPETREHDVSKQIIYSSSQCPQGLCITDDFILLTSYSTEKGQLGELFVFDRESGEYLNTLGMDAKSHLGGIAFDGENVWVCNSDNSILERISYDFICLMAVENRGRIIDASRMVDQYHVENKPSCVTYYDGRLFLGTHTQFMNSSMYAYYYDKKLDQLVQLNSYTIPSKVQGIAIDEQGGIYLSSSYGRRNSSYLYYYDSIAHMDSNINYPTLWVEMPPCSEEVVLEGDRLYLLFESAGEKYLEGTDGNGRSLAPIDRIISLNTASLFEKIKKHK